jgi:hypothetical protein
MKAIGYKAGRALALLLTAGTTLAGPLVVEAPPAWGDPFGFFGGGFMGGMMGGPPRERYYYGPPSRHHRTGGGYQGAPRSSAAAPTPAESSSALAALAPPTSTEQSAVLKSVVPIRALGSVGASDDLQRINEWDRESERDYTGKVEQLLKDLAPKLDDDKKASGGKASVPNDITEHAVLEALDNAVRTTTLIKFETFRDENWSPERLRVMIVERLRIELGDLLDGGKHEATTMHDLETAIAKAARNVQARLFETSELLAANRGSTLFLQRLYQTHGDVSADVRERTEQLLEKAASAGVAPFEPLMQRDPNSYALRYRGERIVYDCLTDSVEAISSGDSGMATEAEIEQRIVDANRNECSKWVAKQLVGGDGVLKTQDPMPLRVIWSAEGPRTDPSMFSRAPDEL